jgi:hypothetical protein
VIGVKASSTLWKVGIQYRSRPPGKPAPEGSSEPEVVRRERLITTADPTGADVHEVARVVELGPNPEPWREFRVYEMHLAAELQGLVTLAPTDAGKLPFDETGAAVLQATASHRGAIGDLSLELALARVRIHELETQLAQRERAREPDSAAPETSA